MCKNSKRTCRGIVFAYLTYCFEMLLLLKHPIIMVEGKLDIKHSFLYTGLDIKPPNLAVVPGVLPGTISNSFRDHCFES